MKIRLQVPMLLFLLIVPLYPGCRTDNPEIRQAVTNQLQRYPESSLQDIYKSFFQDEFGPGHLLEDTAGARNYLVYELSEMASSGNHVAEPCGVGKNFYRVPLDLVKDGIISDNSLFSAFMESASSFRLPDIELWKKKWVEIVIVIERMNLNLPNFDEDKKSLADMHRQGETAMHHSQQYEELYKPHYRILGKEEWEELQKLFPNRQP
ncbi:MAG: hypothetical protein M0Q51_03405 [Bacteroidales bacterium]|nr:hypothetical protein [Bacteroidales bacterium]